MAKNGRKYFIGYGTKAIEDPPLEKTSKNWGKLSEATME